MGWLFLPPNWIAYDKQAHGVLAVWLTLISFPLSLELLNKSQVLATIISFVFVAIVAFGIEFYQKWFTTNRVFDIKDATIMVKVNVIMLIAWNLWLTYYLWA